MFEPVKNAFIFLNLSTKVDSKLRFAFSCIVQCYRGTGEKKARKHKKSLEFRLEYIYHRIFLSIRNDCNALSDTSQSIHIVQTNNVRLKKFSHFEEWLLEIRQWIVAT